MNHSNFREFRLLLLNPLLPFPLLLLLVNIHPAPHDLVRHCSTNSNLTFH